MKDFTNPFGYDRSNLIPLYLCSDGCYRRADQIPSMSTAVAMDAKPVATDNGLSDEDYQLIRKAISIGCRPVARRAVVMDFAGKMDGDRQASADANRAYSRANKTLKTSKPRYAGE